MECVFFVFVYNGVIQYSICQFREGLESVEEESDKEKIIFVESVGRGLIEIKIEGIEDNSDDDVVDL